MRDMQTVPETNNGATIFGIVAVVVIAALIMLFAWRPWAPTPTTTNNSTTTIVQPTTPPATSAPAPQNT